MKNIVITGISTGIGYGATRAFIGKGYRVFGSVRREADAERLRNEFKENFIPLIFDLTDHEAVKMEAEKVGQLIGDEGLQGLINNAGATEGGPLMHFPLDKFRQQLEVLVTGQLAVTQAFLPLLGARRNYGPRPGRVVMISSTSGRSGFPFVGPYAASKHALEGLSKSLRAELLLYGIDVIVIGPGNVKTPIWEKQRAKSYEDYRESDYYDPLVKMGDYLKEMVPKDSIDLDVFSRKLVKIFEKKNPRLRYTLVNKPLNHFIISKVIPEKMKNRFMAGLFGLK